jgi:addiction module RelE/StbE family toxin
MKNMERNSFSLKITPKARIDLYSIYKYISDNLLNVTTANLLMKKIETNIMRLKDFPFSCTHVSDEFLKHKGYRKLVVENYIVFFIVDEKAKQVVIARVLYGRQNYRDII